MTMKTKRGAPTGNKRAFKATAKRATVQARITPRQHAALTEIATARNMKLPALLALVGSGDALVILVPDDAWLSEQFVDDVRALAGGNEAILMLAQALDEARGRHN